MKLLSLLRHAKSSWKDPSLQDHDRPLNKRGERNAPRMGRLLREERRIPDLILSSTARRARETALLVAEASGYAGEVRLHRQLYLADVEDFLDVLYGVPGSVDHALLVSHNPGLEELLERLVGESHALPTAALATLSLPVDAWPEAAPPSGGQLLGLWRPKELDAAGR